MASDNSLALRCWTSPHPILQEGTLHCLWPRVSFPPRNSRSHPIPFTWGMGNGTIPYFPQWDVGVNSNSHPIPQFPPYPAAQTTFLNRKLLGLIRKVIFMNSDLAYVSIIRFHEDNYCNIFLFLVLLFLYCSYFSYLLLIWVSFG